MNKLSTNELVLKSYLRQAIPGASNPRKSLWFEGTKLYSYNSLLAIIDNPNKVLFIDSDIKHYSNTTTKQCATLVKCATGSGFKQLSFPLECSTNAVLAHYWESIDFLIGKFSRARLDNVKKLIKLQILNLLNEVKFYVEYANVDKRTKEYKLIHQITKQLFKHQIL